MGVHGICLAANVACGDRTAASRPYGTEGRVNGRFCLPRGVRPNRHLHDLLNKMKQNRHLLNLLSKSKQNKHFLNLPNKRKQIKLLMYLYLVMYLYLLMYLYL